MEDPTIASLKQVRILEPTLYFCKKEDKLYQLWTDAYLFKEWRRIPNDSEVGYLKCDNWVD